MVTFYFDSQSIDTLQAISIKSHVNILSVNIQQKIQLIVNMFCCNRLITKYEVSVHWANIFWID